MKLLILNYISLQKLNMTYETSVYVATNVEYYDLKPPLIAEVENGFIVNAYNIDSEHIEEYPTIFTEDGSIVFSVKSTKRLLKDIHLKRIIPSENEYTKGVLMGAADLKVTVPKNPFSKSSIKIDLNMRAFVKALRNASDAVEKLKSELNILKLGRKQMKKIIPLPYLVTSDGQQQFLTKKGDTYFASRRDRSLKQVFTQEEYEIVPDLYKPLAKDAEDEFRLEIVPGRWLYVYDGDYGITGDKNMADIFSESDIAFLKNNPDLHIDFEAALVPTID